MCIRDRILVAGCADAAGFGTGEQGRTTLVVDEAVSYTHLDVYKRQTRHCL